MQVEYATDIVFRRKSDLKPIYDEIVRTAVHSVKPENVATFLGRKLNGKFTEWSDAIPVTFTTSGRKTIVSTYWNKRHFYLYVQVEEDKLYSYKRGAAQVDAVQFALAPSNAVTATEAQAKSERSEFLIVDVGGMFGRDRCFQLIRPGQELSVTQEQGSLDTLALNDAQVAVKRQGEITHYECAIPFAAIPTIRPAVGREIRFSLLVHDPDGTGIRDWGEAAGLWPEQRNRLAWCKWDSAKWPADPLHDSKVEFGLCSSKR